MVSCADAGDPVAIKILYDSVHELASSVKAVVERLELCGEGRFSLIVYFLIKCERSCYNA